jgi:FAD dependent oxidoreductase
MNLRTLITTIFLAFSIGSLSHGRTSADVIVYGSTPGGYCAAIAAAREGVSVILLEPTTHVGGMNTGGLSFSDSDQMYREQLMGLFHEWHLRIQNDYLSRGVTLPYDVNVKNQTPWSYEAKVASKVTKEMLTEAGVKVLTGRYLQSVTKTGPRINSIVTSNGTFTGRVFIDGSYEGDLMDSADVSWRIDRESRAEYGESHAGRQYPKPIMNINGFDEQGKPLPLITAVGRGADEIGDDELMVYSYRVPMTKNAANKVPMPAPANYDPARFELIRRYVAAHTQNKVNFSRLLVPNDKIDANNEIGSQFSIGLIGGAKDWAEADQAGRAKILEAHKQYTLEMIHFMKTDPVFTQTRRDDVAGFGLCADEFTDSGHFPPQLYVRASRRMKGMYVIKQSDILENITKPDPIMVSSFPLDSHDCRRVVQPDGKVINEGTIFPVRQMPQRIGYPYHVPYRSILPLPAECDNLLVPVALSCTHVAMSSLRIEATWMLIGQSAGIAAALVKNKDIAVQDLPYATLKPRLEAQGQVLTLPKGFKSGS